MTEERQDKDSGDKSWIEKISTVFLSKPKTREQFSELLGLAQDNEIIDDDARNIIEGAMQVSEMQVRDIMIPRSQMQVLRTDQALKEILSQITKSKHSRYPVVGENPDEVLGILLAKDLLPQILKANNGNFDINKLLRPCFVVPESKRLYVLLGEFRQNRNHMAIVIDGYGSITGLATIEDVLEEIVGEIEDETDQEADHHINKVDDENFIVSAHTPISEFNEAVGADFSDEEFDTIGGHVMQHFGYLPSRNETTTLEGYEFKVMTVDQRKILSLHVHILEQAPDESQ